MKKKIIIIVLCVLVLGSGIFYFNRHRFTPLYPAEPFGLEAVALGQTPRDQFINALPVMKTIVSAQQRYYKKYGRFAPNLESINYYFARGVSDFVDSIGDRNICFEGGLCVIISEESMAVFNSLGKKENAYFLSADYIDGSTFCASESAESKQVCLDLGGFAPEIDESDPDFVVYRLKGEFLGERILGPVVE